MTHTQSHCSTGVHAPARFVDGDDGAAADGGAQRVIGGLQLAGRAVDGVHQAAARDRQPAAVAQQRRDLAVGQAVALVEQHGEGDGLRTQLHGWRRRARRTSAADGVLARVGRIGCTRPTCTSKRANDGPLHRQLFLVLRARRERGAPARSSADSATGSGASIGFVDVSRRRPMARTGHTPHPALRPGRCGSRHARPARERRRLPIDGAPRGLELVFQLLVFAPQPLALGFRSSQVLPQPVDLAPLARR